MTSTVAFTLRPSALRAETYSLYVQPARSLVKVHRRVLALTSLDIPFAHR